MHKTKEIVLNSSYRLIIFDNEEKKADIIDEKTYYYTNLDDCSFLHASNI